MIRNLRKNSLNTNNVLRLSLLLLLLITSNIEAQNIIDKKYLISITTTNNADSLKLLLVGNSNLKYNQQLIVGLRLFSIEKNNSNLCILGKLIPNTKERAGIYWEIDRYVWMERSLNIFFKEYKLESESFNYLRLNSFFELGLLNPNYIRDIYSFTLYSQKYRQVEEFSDFYIAYIKKYEERFFSSIKLLPYQDAQYIIRLIDDFADQNILIELKKTIKEENLFNYNSFIEEK